MEFVKVLILLSCLVVLANGAHIYFEPKEYQELRTKRDTSAESETGVTESKALESAETKRILTERKVNEDSKQVDSADGEEQKNLGVITNPFGILSSVFNKEPTDGTNNQQISNKPSASYGSGNLQNSPPQNPWFGGHDQFVNPPFMVPGHHFDGNDKPFIFHLTDSNNFYNGPRPFPPKKPSFELSQEFGTSGKPNYGGRSITKKKFLSLFKPVMALASIFKKPIIMKPVTNEVVAMNPQASNSGYNRPQLDLKPSKPTKPSTQGQKPYFKPNSNLPFRPVYLRPHYGNWGMPSHDGFGPFGPFRRPHWSHGLHDFPMGYQAKATDDDAEPETAAYYMIDDEDESQRQEYPVLIPADLIDELSFVDDEDEVSFESRTLAEQKSDVNEATLQDIPASTEKDETKIETSTEKKEV